MPRGGPRRNVKTFQPAWEARELTEKEKKNIRFRRLDWTGIAREARILESAADWRLGWGTGNEAHLHEIAYSDTTDVFVQGSERIAAMVEDWVRSYVELNPASLAFKGFKYHWKLVRTWVPLQLRLAVEQHLYSKGKPWSSLVSGFRPL